MKQDVDGFMSMRMAGQSSVSVSERCADSGADAVERFGASNHADAAAGNDEDQQAPATISATEDSLAAGFQQASLIE